MEAARGEGRAVRGGRRSRSRFHCGRPRRGWPHRGRGRRARAGPRDVRGPPPRAGRFRLTRRYRAARQVSTRPGAAISHRQGRDGHRDRAAHARGPRVRRRHDRRRGRGPARPPARARAALRAGTPAAPLGDGPRGSAARRGRSLLRRVAGLHGLGIPARRRRLRALLRGPAVAPRRPVVRSGLGGSEQRRRRGPGARGGGPRPPSRGTLAAGDPG